MNKKKLDWVRALLLTQAMLFTLTSMYYAIVEEDTNKWFVRWSLAMVLYGLWGIMEHIKELKE